MLFRSLLQKRCCPIIENLKRQEKPIINLYHYLSSDFLKSVSGQALDAILTGLPHDVQGIHLRSIESVKEIYFDNLSAKRLAESHLFLVELNFKALITLTFIIDRYSVHDSSYFRSLDIAIWDLAAMEEELYVGAELTAKLTIEFILNSHTKSIEEASIKHIERTIS